MRLISPIRLIGLTCPICLLLAASLLAACSSDPSEDITPSPEPIPDLETPITFSGNLQKDSTVTRATGLEESQTSFIVYGYKNVAYDSGTGSYTSYQTVFPGFTVKYGSSTAMTTTSNTSDWEYVGVTAAQTIKYWDWGAAAYRFFGYALGTGSSPVAVTAGSASGTPVVQTLSATVDASSDAAIAAAPYFTHLWFSTGDPVAYPDKQFGSPVTLTFVKPFARVRFMFTFAEGLSFGREVISSPVFKPTADDAAIATAGTVTVTYPLTGTGTAETWASTAATAATATIASFDIDYYDADDSYEAQSLDANVYDNTPQKWYDVLPQSLGAFTLTVQVGTLASTAQVSAEYMDWKAGYEYTYKFKILEGGGVVLEVVKVGINSWNNIKDVTHTVYNW